MGRQRQVDCVREHERKLAFQAQQRQVADALALLMRPFRPEVLSRLQPWVSQYQSVQLRYKFLVLRGGSQTGKSTLAKSLGHLFGWRRPFVQTVQSAEAPDLKAYSPEEHGYILFDNVNHMDFILNERALFQANNDLHTLGASRDRYLFIFGVALSLPFGSHCGFVRCLGGIRAVACGQHVLSCFSMAHAICDLLSKRKEPCYQ